jgi:hypothetical protein
MYKVEDDGVTHINIYSKAKTKLGLFLSNFTKHAIQTEDGPFQSIEGYWYWLSSKDDNLRRLYGWEAKKYGRSIKAKDWMDDEEFKRKICAAIREKVLDSFYVLNLATSTLPLVHYYAYGDKIVEPEEGKWVIEYIESLRAYLKEEHSKHEKDEY